VGGGCRGFGTSAGIDVAVLRYQGDVATAQGKDPPLVDHKIVAHQRAHRATAHGEDAQVCRRLVRQIRGHRHQACHHRTTRRKQVQRATLLGLELATKHIDVAAGNALRREGLGNLRIKGRQSGLGTVGDQGLEERLITRQLVLRAAGCIAGRQHGAGHRDDTGSAFRQIGVVQVAARHHALAIARSMSRSAFKVSKPGPVTRCVTGLL